MRPKLYCLEILASNGDIRYHKRCKGIPSKNVDSITIEDFTSMIHDELVITESYEEYKRDFKHIEESAITRVQKTKEINQHRWRGRIYDPVTGYWHAIK